jgi:hypothetical protein
MPLSVKAYFATLSINDFQNKLKLSITISHYGVYQYTENRILFISMLSVILLNVVLSIVMLNIVAATAED